ncbi:Mth938-like domain-containing protein [Thermodesulfobacteriota bacterium]
MIENISFGRIVINGIKYDSDVLIYPDERVTDSWWRKEGHKLSIADIQSLLETGPDILVTGTGMSGMMKPETELIDYLKMAEIRFIALENKKAVEQYNNLLYENKITACFHLTC